MKAPKNPSPKPSALQVDEIQDSLDAIIAISDLLGCIGSAVKEEHLHENTVADAAFLIQRETLNVTRLLGLRSAATPTRRDA